MKNYKVKQERRSDNEQLRFIFENRLRLQSIQRFLDGRKVPQKSFDYLTSKDFFQNHFLKWGTYERKIFLEKMVGRDWKRLEEILEKE
jgi:hypothetical protein